MSVRMRKYSETTLRKRLEKLEERLHSEKLRLHHQIGAIGWGTGMRCTRCTPSFRQEEELKRKIEKLKLQIREQDPDIGKIQ